MQISRMSAKSGVILALILGAATPAYAVDTVETWDAGATDIDFYVGLDGVGLGRNDGSVSGDLMIGYGVVEGLSLYLGATLSATEQLAEGAGELYLGTFGTPLNTDHVDLDLFFGFRLGGEDLSELQIEPALELNFDLLPDLGSWGLYAVVGAPIHCQRQESQSGDERHRRVFAIDATIGTYLTVAENHQILLDFGMTFRPMARGDERAVEVGGIGLGYNVTVHDALELITEVRLDLPQEGEETSVGFVVGMIATLPGARSATSER